MASSLLLEPIQVGPFRLRNRIMMTTHNPKMTEGRYRDYLRERVANASIVGIPFLHEPVTSLSFVSTGRVDPVYSMDLDALPDLTTDAGQELFDKIIGPRLKACADIIHEGGSLGFGQLGERGASKLPETFQPRVAPSTTVDPQVCAAPYELEIEDLERLVRIFGKSAARVKRAGFDGVEIHAAHGYLIEQFFSPLTNHRTDCYGGSFENRIRFLEEIIAEIRKACGPDYPISMRLTAHQPEPGGWTIEDAQKLVQKVGSSMVYINITSGTVKALRSGVTTPYVAPWPFPPGFNVAAAAAIKAVSPAPVVVTGRFVDPELMEQVLADGKADMIGMAREFMADPKFTQKLKSGQTDRIRRCIGANECHYSDRPSGCAINASVGREEELRFVPAIKQKKILVVGGGPAGLELARAASLRGHDVTLLEKSTRLGGQIAMISADKNRGDMRSYLDFLIREVAHQGVKIELNVDATSDTLRKRQADAVVIASGSVPKCPDVPNLRPKGVFSAYEIFQRPNDVGNRVLVVGGLDDHLKPPTTAEYLADQGKQVVLISQCMNIGQGLEPAAFHLLLKRILDKGIEVRTLTELVSDGEHPRLRHVFTRRETEIEPCDSIVFAAEHRANDSLWKASKGIAAEVYRIGDCLAPRRLIHATLDGARIAARL